MRFHFVMLLIVIFVSLGMHTMASAASAASMPALDEPALPAPLASSPDRRGDAGT